MNQQIVFIKLDPPKSYEANHPSKYVDVAIYFQRHECICTYGGAGGARRAGHFGYCVSSCLGPVFRHGHSTEQSGPGHRAHRKSVVALGGSP